MTDAPKQYRLKHPVTIALVADDDNEIVLRTHSNALMFVGHKQFEENWEPVPAEQAEGGWTSS